VPCRCLKGNCYGLGFEAGIGFFLALVLCFGVCKIVMAIGRGVAHAIARFRRTRRSRSLAQGMALTFARHRADPVDSDAKCNPVDSIGSSTKSRVSHSERRPSARFPGDKDGSARGISSSFSDAGGCTSPQNSGPLESYDWALSNVAHLEQYLSTLPPNEEASATAAQLVAQAKAVVAVCERALRIERIAKALDSIAVRDRFEAMLEADDIAWADAEYIAKQRTPAGQVERAKFTAMDRADIAAAKTGPLTWYTPDCDSWYKDADGKVQRLGPRGLGLSVTNVAAAEAELDGFTRHGAKPVDDGRWASALQRMAIAANRVLAA
jgi:hypothetical protein